METSISTTTQQAAAPELAGAVVAIFKTFARAFSHRWLATHTDPKAPIVWERGLHTHGITAAVAKAAVVRAIAREWPPTLGEFIALCRDPLPDLQTAKREAFAWARGERMEAWSHPVIGAAAATVGTWALRIGNDREVDAKLTKAMTDAMQRYNRGDLLNVPILKSLPKPVHMEDKRTEIGDASIAELCARLGVSA